MHTEKAAKATEGAPKKARRVDPNIKRADVFEFLESVPQINRMTDPVAVGSADCRCKKSRQTQFVFGDTVL